MSSLAATTTRRGLTITRTSILKPILSTRLPSRSYCISSTRVIPSISPRWTVPMVSRYKSTDAAAKSSWGPPIVSYEELKPLTEQPSDEILLIDVREPDEIALGSIPSSVSIPLSVLKDHLKSNFSEGEFRKEHGFPKPLPTQKIIFYCRSGKRSATACEQASENGYRNIRNYEGSWLDWTKREKERGSGYKDEDDD